MHAQYQCADIVASIFAHMSLLEVMLVSLNVLDPFPASGSRMQVELVEFGR